MLTPEQIENAPKTCDECHNAMGCDTYFAVRLCKDENCTCKSKKFTLPAKVSHCESWRLFFTDEGFDEACANADKARREDP